MTTTLLDRLAEHLDGQQSLTAPEVRKLHAAGYLERYHGQMHRGISVGKKATIGESISKRNVESWTSSNPQAVSKSQQYTWMESTPRSIVATAKGHVEAYKVPRRTYTKLGLERHAHEREIIVVGKVKHHKVVES